MVWRWCFENTELRYRERKPVDSNRSGSVPPWFRRLLVPLPDLPAAVTAAARFALLVLATTAAIGANMAAELVFHLKMRLVK